MNILLVTTLLVLVGLCHFGVTATKITTDKDKLSRIIADAIVKAQQTDVTQQKVNGGVINDVDENDDMDTAKKDDGVTKDVDKNDDMDTAKKDDATEENTEQNLNDQSINDNTEATSNDEKEKSDKIPDDVVMNFIQMGLDEMKLEADEKKVHLSDIQSDEEGRYQHELARRGWWKRHGERLKRR